MLKTCAKILRSLHSGMRRLYSVHPQQPIVVAVEGNIGSGKTFLLEHFAGSNAEVYMEPVASWRNIGGHNGLQLMYHDPARWALTFQTYVQLTMLQTHVKQQVKPVKMMERSIFSAKYCFAENLYKSGLMPDVEYQVLTEWFDFLVQNHRCQVDLIVYLRTSPETVFDRIKSRCREEESEISLGYLKSLHELHEDWLIRKNKFTLPAPVMVLDANEDKDAMLGLYETRRERILCGHA